MLVIIFAFLAIASGVSAAPSRQKRFDVFDPFPGAFAISRPFGASYAGVGLGWPFFQPSYPWYMPMPMPDFSQFIPWYKGPNVCETKKVFDEPEEMKEWMSEGFSDSTSFKQESESCRGNNDKYVCMGRIETNEGSKMEMRKYQCCYGFVRPMDGRPGCVENSDEQEPSSSPTVTSTTPSSIRLNDQMRYSYFKSNRRSGAENVPAQ